jgi:hypothetical protein
MINTVWYNELITTDKYPGHVPVLGSLYIVLVHLLHQELPVNELVTVP